MAREEDWKYIERGMAAAIREGSVSVPTLLIRLYRYMKLSDSEAMLLIQLIAFKEKEDKSFPTLEELQSRLSASPDQAVRALQRLVQEQYIQIEEEIDPHTGVQGERYNLMPLYRKLAAAWVDVSKEEALSAATSRAKRDTADNRSDKQTVIVDEEADLFTVFEREFARPLSPMECETIAQWVDKDQYPEQLILFALKEAVFAGVVQFRYIDRILLEWSRNRVQTPEQAREYTQKFRGSR